MAAALIGWLLALAAAAEPPETATEPAPRDEAAPEPPEKPEGELPVPEPALSPDAIQEVLREGQPRVRACFARVHPIPTRIAPTLTIGAGGTVTEASLGCPDCAPELARCVEQALKALQFPDPGEGVVEISWPWNVDPID